MKLFPPLVQIDENEGFNPAKDIFGRKKIGEELTHLISQVEDPLLLAVDGQWGSGKTVFLKMWQGELKKLGFPVVYFDAFANDYMEDAFVPLAAEIIGLAQTKLKADLSKLDDFKVKTTKVAKVVMRSALKIGIKVATFGALDAGDIEGTIADEVETVFDKHIGELITKHDVVKSDMVAFKEALESLPKLFSPDFQSDEQVKPIVVIIDELDRCRPSYALQLLERMKHFFSVPKVHFVLGVNLDQLANSVVATYGPGIDGRLYLQKFIQLSIQLHDRFEHDEITTSSKFLAHLIVQSDIKGKNHTFVSECKNELQRISQYANFDLRTLEQIYGHIIRVAASVPENHFRNESIIVGLAILKVKYPKLFLKAKDKSLEYSEVLTAFALLDSNDPKYNSKGNGYERRLRDQSWFENLWRYTSDKDCSESLIAQMRETVRNNFRTRFDYLPYCANNQIDKFSSA